jgi:hypothetical protein
MTCLSDGSRFFYCKKMSNFRINKRQDFAQIPNELLKDKDISMEALGLITRLLCNSNSWTSNIHELCKNGSKYWTEYQISKAFKELALLGYAKLVKVYDYDKGCFKGSYYDIYDDKELCKISPKLIYIGEKQTPSNTDPLFFRQSVNDCLINNTNPITILNNNNSITDLEKKSVCVCDLENKKDCELTVINPVVKKEKELAIDFELAWKAYRSKGSKQKSLARWLKLSQEEKDICAVHIPNYASTREPRFQKDFESYLLNKTFNDIIVSLSNTELKKEYINQKENYVWATDFKLHYQSSNEEMVAIEAYEKRLRELGFEGGQGEVAKMEKSLYEIRKKEHEDKKLNK